MTSASADNDDWHHHRHNDRDWNGDWDHRGRYDWDNREQGNVYFYRPGEYPGECYGPNCYPGPSYGFSIHER